MAIDHWNATGACREFLSSDLRLCPRERGLVEGKKTTARNISVLGDPQTIREHRGSWYELKIGGRSSAIAFRSEECGTPRIAAPLTSRCDKSLLS